jgi:hypothetical protein
MVVNIEFVSFGKPEARITRTALATASLTPPVASLDDGLILIAASMLPGYTDPPAALRGAA